MRKPPSALLTSPLMVWYYRWPQYQLFLHKQPCSVYLYRYIPNTNTVLDSKVNEGDGSDEKVEEEEYDDDDYVKAEVPTPALTSAQMDAINKARAAALASANEFDLTTSNKVCVKCGLRDISFGKMIEICTDLSKNRILPSRYILC